MDLAAGLILASLPFPDAFFILLEKEIRYLTQETSRKPKLPSFLPCSLTHHIPTSLPIPPQHIPNHRPRRLHVRNREQAVIVLVLRVDDHKHAVLWRRLGGGNAEEAGILFFCY